ncbi:MAG TPA: NADH-quinone oxidoreductase subunit NuoB [Candidatus Omnitrophica bacterium]|nr:MAG: NADH:ubiquinone oxidoreductase [Candidatus Omnitrophota bacterium]RKY35730.1 MAG: NADH:ubiquinone oxidoreductase [Candidatus Omnitrophota bacterium]RKY44579.1 MAG: NADH:ubiquinone oxidoreductase [Candidatus Omnitrophota bacterium]HEC69981.1 NADH-quinone oxidoreductase subunit NuoB [Candidatus Omnitrophota bacterium]
MGLKEKILTKSLWVFHISAGSCNNCDIEILDLLTPRYDVERFGIQLIGSIRHADVLLITGAMNKKSLKRLKKLYTQAPKPCFVVAVGSCTCSQQMFKPSYSMQAPLDEIIPVDLYIPGCPPKPEAIISGIVKLIKKVNR